MVLTMHVAATAERVAEQATAAQVEDMHAKETFEASCTQLCERVKELEHLLEGQKKELRCAEHSRVRVTSAFARSVMLWCMETVYPLTTFDQDLTPAHSELSYFVCPQLNAPKHILVGPGDPCLNCKETEAHAS
jgi:hypothetical protein